ncbi:MAG: PD40 domain-containing protein [Candidatus Zixiibacteriota bacterium]|nr:MAG: PD40 domain-containing protein [candidate division Zixibacteria bacterium]
MMRNPVIFRACTAITALLVLVTCSKLSVNQAAPDVPSAPSPADGDALDSVSIELSWTCSDPDGDPLSYDIYLDTSSTPEVLVATVDTTVYTPVGLHYNFTYYWQVVATDTTGLETEGPIWSFSFGADMITPSCSLIAPNGGEFWYVDTDHDIEWEASDDDSIAFVELEYSLDAGDSWVRVDSLEGNPQVYSWTIPDSIYSTRCLIRMSCHDSGDNVTSDTSDAIFTVWPQGGLIAFTSDRDGQNNLFTMWADGSHQRKITDGAEGDYDASWSPDCSKIAFASYSGGIQDIYIMNSDGSDPVNISNNATSHDNRPFWSPNGDKIAFSSYRTGNWEVYIMNPDGSEQYNLTVNGAADYYCSWNPEGDRLAFHSNRGGNWDIYLMDDDGSNQTRITTSGAVDAYPSWSPNGLLIVFRSNIPGNNDIYLMNVDGSLQTNISNHGGDDQFPRWSPDGMRIIFCSNRTGDFEIYVMNIDGTNLQNLSNTPGYSDVYPSWSPIY